MKIKKQVLQNVNPILVKHVTQNLFPVYDTFDSAHNSKHIVDVIHRSFLICKSVQNQINLNLVFAVASYHDIGLVKGRQGHANVSSEIVKSDEILFSLFTESEVNQIAIAVQDHSLSKNQVPRTLYGKIVADADKDHNPKRSLKRMWQFSLAHFPNRTKTEHLTLCYEYFYGKYGKNGRVTYYIPCRKTQTYLKKMQRLANNQPKFMEWFSKLIK